MANWNPDSFTGQMFKVTTCHVPSLPGIAAPVLWGDERTVRGRLGPYFRNIETKLIPVDFDLPTSPVGAVAFFRRYFGPTNVAFSRLDEAGQVAFASDLESLWTSANAAPALQSHTLIHNQYLQVTAVRI